MGTMIKLPRAALWACAIFLAVAFVLVGMSKLSGPSATRWNDRFVQWGYPASARPVVGVLEILGGLGLLFTGSRRVAAAMLIVLMIGAVLTHLLQAEFTRLLPPLILGGLAALVYAAHRPASG
jgi:uncharacterized membrane protein YphA (DoxX/SURF4 family)